MPIHFHMVVPAGAVLRALLHICLALSFLGGCADPTIREYEIGGARYAFPEEHIIISRRDPPLFLRLSPPDEAYHLVFDGETSERTDAFGRPFIFSVSGAPVKALRRVETSEAVVLCRTGSSPVGSCGTSIRVHGANWSVLIPPARLSEAASIVRQAKEMLASYRVR